MEKTQKKHYKDTVGLAKIAKELFRSGMSTNEITKRMDKSLPTIKRYYQMTGGISDEDMAAHYRNRAKKA